MPDDCKASWAARHHRCSSCVVGAAVARRKAVQRVGQAGKDVGGDHLTALVEKMPTWRRSPEDVVMDLDPRGSKIIAAAGAAHSHRRRVQSRWWRCPTARAQEAGVSGKATCRGEMYAGHPKARYGAVLRPKPRKLRDKFMDLGRLPSVGTRSFPLQGCREHSGRLRQLVSPCSNTFPPGSPDMKRRRARSRSPQSFRLSPEP